MKYKIIVFEKNGRLRARMTDETGRSLGEWWIESASHKRYNPFKPMPPLVNAIINRLPRHEIERIWFFLVTAKDGDSVEFEVRFP